MLLSPNSSVFSAAAQKLWYIDTRDDTLSAALIIAFERFGSSSSHRYELFHLITVLGTPSMEELLLKWIEGGEDPEGGRSQVC